MEHKSYPDRRTVFQLLRYMVRIWERELERFRFDCRQGSRGEARGVYMPVHEHAETEG
jgi:hypothetical protein